MLVQPVIVPSSKSSEKTTHPPPPPPPPAGVRTTPVTAQLRVLPVRFTWKASASAGSIVLL